MGRAEDALTYGGVTHYIIDEDEKILKEIAKPPQQIVAITEKHLLRFTMP